MSGNRSLDEFAGAGAGDDPGDGGAEASGAGSDVATDEASADRSGESAAVTDSTDGSDATGSTDAVDTADASDAPDAPTDGVGAPAADDDGGTDGEALDPPASTYVWSPDGAPCAGCGSTVEERWRDGEDLVCAGCKEW